MATTFTKIADTVVGAGGIAYIEFTAIPATYTDLCIKLSGRSNSSGPSLYVQFNSSGGTAYSVRTLNGTGGGVSSSTGSSAAFNLFSSAATGSDATASTFSNIEIYIPNYAGSANKTLTLDAISERNSASAYNFASVLGAGQWANTAAITSVLLDFDGDFVQYSTATLYGISKS